MQIKTLRVVYVVSLFPCWSETFILNEIIELVNSGTPVSIYSIRCDLEPFIQAKARPFMTRTEYGRRKVVLFAALRWFICRPRVILSLLLRTLFCAYRHPGNIRLKNIWSILCGCHLADQVTRERISHIHAHFATYPALTAMTASRLTRVPFTFTAHAHDIFLDKALLRLKAAAAKRIIAISAYNRDYLCEHTEESIRSKIRVVHCGLDMSLWQLSDRTKVVTGTIVAIGRLTPMKGFRHLVRACAQLKTKGIRFRCHLVGDGPLRGEITDLIQRHGLQEHVMVEGVMDSAQVRSLLGKTDIFAVPSVWDDADGQDGIPLVLMEAMALGVPCVASRISGIPELVEDGISGLLIDPGNDVQLANKLTVLLASPEMRAKFAANGRCKVEQEFNIKSNAALLKHVFN